MSALSDQLAAAESVAHLVVIGGSALIAIDAVSRSTSDVDVMALKTQGGLISADPLPAPIVKAAAIVARDLGLDPNWLNTGPAGLLHGGLPIGFAERMVERDYGAGLCVSFASRIDQIFFKLYAAADRREPRDFADLRQLQPTAAELRNAARWARTHNMPGPFDDAITETLRDFGVADEGRET